MIGNNIVAAASVRLCVETAHKQEIKVKAVAASARLCVEMSFRPFG